MNFNSRASPDKQHVVVWSVCQPRLVWLAPGPGPSVVRSDPPFRHNRDKTRNVVTGNGNAEMETKTETWKQERGI